MTQRSPDVILLQETCMRPSQKAFLPNYILYRNDNDLLPDGTAYGGTAIYIKRTIPHHRIDTPTLNSLEATIVAVTIPTLINFHLVSVYCRAGYPSTFTTDLDTLFALHANVMVCGDFNAKHPRWNKGNSNRYGRIISEYVDRKSLFIAAPPTPTRFGPTSSNTLDFALCKNIPYSMDMTSIPTLCSDHNPVVLTLDVRFSVPHPQGAVYTDWSKFQEHLIFNSKYSLSKITSKDELELETIELTNTILNAHKAASKNYIQENAHYLPKQIKELIREKNKAKRTWQRFRDPEDKRSFNRLQSRIKSLIKKHTQKEWTDHIASLSAEDSSLWDVTRRCKRSARKIPALTGPASIAYSDNAKAEVLADCFQTQFRENHTLDYQTERDISETVKEFLNKPYINNTEPTCPSEIQTYIKKLKIRKAPGKDSITNKMMKNVPIIIVIHLAHIINNVLKLCHFPSCWKTACIVPLPKPGKDARQPVSYRPISLLPTLSKICEFIILNRLNGYLYPNKIIIPQQFGFQRKLSTSHQLLRVTEYITAGKSAKLTSIGVFLDVEKAFDKIWIIGLIHKQISFGIPDALIHLIHSYLTGRQFVIHACNTYSTVRDILAGTPQGSLLGPTLFNLYMNDIPQTPHTFLSLFADDTAILSQGYNVSFILQALKIHLHELENWFSKWKIKINVTKSNAIIFSNSTKTYKPLTLAGDIINWSHTTQYLGVILDSRLTWSHHYNHISNKFRAAVNKLTPLMARNSPLPCHVKLLCYKVCLRPIITYAAPVWGFASPTTLKKFQVLENSVIRHKIARARWFVRNRDIFQALNLKPLTSVLAALAGRMYDSLTQIDNVEIQMLVDDNYDFTELRNSKRPRAVLKYLEPP